MNIGLLLEMAADAGSDRVAVGPHAGGITAGDLLVRAWRAAGWFLGRGAAHVGLVDLNTEAVPLALFGAALAGVPFAPVNFRLTDDQLNGILRRLTPGVAIVGPDIVDRLIPVPGLETITRNEFLALTEGPGAADTGDLPFVDTDDVAVLLFTSGTTGEPKAAVLRHKHLASYIINSVDFMGADPDEAQLVSVPSYHVAGISAILSSIYGGRRIMYVPVFDPARWVETCRAEQISHAMVVPTMLGRILAELERNELGLPSLCHLSYGGGRMPRELIERAMQVLPDVAYVNAYGLTETSSTISVLTPEDHRNALSSSNPEVRERLGSVGRPLPSVELEIRDAEGRVVPAGARGEIYVRGEQVAGEYLGRRVLTDDGWFPTNDAGHVDEWGFLYLDGRLDDVIVRGAENISPGEIEEVLVGHPAVAEAAVIGVADPEWGEAIAAAVVLAPGTQVTAEDLQDWVKARLRSTKTPQLIQFRETMPYNETGKLLRRVLRDELSSGRP